MFGGFCKKSVLRNFTKFTEKHVCQSLFFNEVAVLSLQIFEKKTLAHAFSSEFCDISKNTFCYRILPVAASEYFLMFHLAELFFTYFSIILCMTLGYLDISNPPAFFFLCFFVFLSKCLFKSWAVAPL